MDQLKSEIKEKERQCHTIETREAYSRQEISQKHKDALLKCDDLKDSLRTKENELKSLQEALELCKDKLQKAEVKIQAYDLSMRFSGQQLDGGKVEADMVPIRLNQ